LPSTQTPKQMALYERLYKDSEVLKKRKDDVHILSTFQLTLFSLDGIGNS
jgi:hypothetical protein